jgi:hypothetical protein
MPYRNRSSGCDFNRLPGGSRSRQLPASSHLFPATPCESATAPARSDLANPGPPDGTPLLQIRDHAPRVTHRATHPAFALGRFRGPPPEEFLPGLGPCRPSLRTRSCKSASPWRLEIRVVTIRSMGSSATQPTHERFNNRIRYISPFVTHCLGLASGRIPTPCGTPSWIPAFRFWSPLRSTPKKSTSGGYA